MEDIRRNSIAMVQSAIRRHYGWQSIAMAARNDPRKHDRAMRGMRQARRTYAIYAAKYCGICGTFGHGEQDTQACPIKAV